MKIDPALIRSLARQYGKHILSTGVGRIKIVLMIPNINDAIARKLLDFLKTDEGKALADAGPEPEQPTTPAAPSDGPKKGFVASPTGANPHAFRDEKTPIIRDEEQRTISTFLGEDYGWITFTFEQFAQIRKDYSREWEGVALNQDQMAVEHGFPNAHAVARFVKIHGIRQTSIPFTDEELEKLGPEGAAELATESQKKKYFRAAQRKREEKRAMAAAKWFELEANLDELFKRRYERQAPPILPIELQAEASDFAVVIAPKDLHYGKIATNYNRKVARERLIRTSSELIQKATRFGVPEKIFFVFGSDGVNVDGPQNQTTAGTPQGLDGLWVEVVEEYLDLNIEVICHLARFAPVEVVVEPGNHDFATITALGFALAREFRDHDRVTVTRRASEFRVYVNYGLNTLAFMHGDRMKAETHLPKLFLIEARDQGLDLQPNLIAFTGHLHHDRQADLGGVDWIQVPSLSGHDQWSRQHAYLSREQAAAYLIDRTSGKAAVLYARA